MLAGIWAISEMNFYPIFEDMDIFGPMFSKEIPPIIFRETITSDKNPFKELSPANGCVRHQFIPFMVKVAARKYKLEPKINITYTEAVTQFLDEYQTKMEKYDPNPWR